MAIDIGSGAVYGDTNWTTNYTIIDLLNPANASGSITTVELYPHEDMTGVKVAIFYLTSGSTYAVRSVANIGNVAGGAKRTFSVNLSVQENDYIGIYVASGSIRGTKKGGDNKYKLGDQTGGTTSYLSSYEKLSLYGTGISASMANLKSYNTNLKANIKTINGNPIANVKSLNTNT